MTAGENVLLTTMKLDKTVNQQGRPFIPREKKKTLIEKRKRGRKYQLAKTDPN